jgi:hypothetical protein
VTEHSTASTCSGQIVGGHCKFSAKITERILVATKHEIFSAKITEGILVATKHEIFSSRPCSSFNTESSGEARQSFAGALAPE